MKKGILSITLALVMVASLVVGCGNKKDDDGGDKITLTFLDKHPEEEYAGYFEQAISDFEKQNPNVKIKYENISDQAIKEKLSVLASGGDMPDVFFTWGGESLYRFARSEKALDLTPYLEKDSEWKDGFLPSFLNSATFDGKTYAVPYRSFVLYMLYNKQIFADNNLEIPKTWDEFLNVCETLKGNGVTPLAYGNSQNWYATWWVGQLNANLVDAETIKKDYNAETGDFTDPRYVKAVQYFLDLNNKGYFGENVNSKDYYQVREEFCAGKQAMMLDATSQFSFFSDAMGTDGYGFFKIPTVQGADGDPATVTGGSELYAVSAKSEHPDEAAAFIKFMTSKEQGFKQTKETALPNALIGGVTSENADKVLEEAYVTAEDYTSIAEWLDQVVDGSVANAYMASLQEGLDGKPAADVMQDIQKAAKDVAEARK